MQRPAGPLLIVPLLLVLLAADSPGAQEGAVTLHAGAVWADLERVSFETVTSVAGQDAFARVPGPGSRLEPAILLSHRVTRSGRVGIHATLGAAPGDPGETLLLGLSADLRRAFLTVGAATALVEKGREPLEDDLFGRPGSRTVYAGLERKRRWGVFLGLSLGLLP